MAITGLALTTVGVGLVADVLVMTGIAVDTLDDTVWMPLEVVDGVATAVWIDVGGTSAGRHAVTRSNGRCASAGRAPGCRALGDGGRHAVFENGHRRRFRGPS